jgi:hypothetical protein
MKNRTLFHYQTQHGRAEIRAEDGRFPVYFEGYDLGSYPSPQHAAQDLSTGSTFSHPSGIDLSELGIPADLQQWVSHIA